MGVPTIFTNTMGFLAVSYESNKDCADKTIDACFGGSWVYANVVRNLKKNYGDTKIH